MTIEEFAKSQRIQVDDLKLVANYINNKFDWSSKEKVDVIKFLVMDDNSSFRDILEEQLHNIMKSSLYEKYYSSWGKYRRSSIKIISINNSFDSIQYFNKLILDIDRLVHYKENVPEDVLKDISDFKDMVFKTEQLCMINDGVIGAPEFDLFFGILYGIYEGIQSFLGRLDGKIVDSEFLSFFRDQTKDKAFRESILSSKDSKDLLKGLFSLGTHLVITCQNHPEFKNVCDELINRNLELIQDFLRTGDISIVDRVVL